MGMMYKYKTRQVSNAQVYYWNKSWVKQNQAGKSC